AERAEQIVTNLMDRAMDGHGTAMRLCLDRLVPTGHNRPVAIELPVVKTPEDVELALMVVLDEFAAGKLTVSELSALITAIQRMLRLAERMWKFQQARAEAAAADQEAPQQEAQAPQPAEKPAASAAPLYSPVNSGGAAGTDATAAPARKVEP